VTYETCPVCQNIGGAGNADCPGHDDEIPEDFRPAGLDRETASAIWSTKRCDGCGRTLPAAEIVVVGRGWVNCGDCAAAPATPPPYCQDPERCGQNDPISEQYGFTHIAYCQSCEAAHALEERGMPLIAGASEETLSQRIDRELAEEAVQAEGDFAQGRCWVCQRKLADYPSLISQRECYFCSQELACLVAEAEAEFGVKFQKEV
jgi:hypothetical protein